MNAEQTRIQEKRNEEAPTWYRWGPYVAERMWGTVREDYSWNGDAWNFFPFEDSHHKAYRWGEDGIAGWCDRYQVLVFAPAFWNGKDPILKERLFGLSSPQGNHGEDVKEMYYHLDGTPTHSYMLYLYKYPHNRFPYELLKEKNGQRGTNESEYEIFDTGIFDKNKYFDIFIEYAKATPEDLCIKIEAFNRGDEPADLHIIPQLIFRNQWSWWDMHLPEPSIVKQAGNPKCPCLVADDTDLLAISTLSFDYRLGKRYLYGSEGGLALFTNNESRSPDKRYYKDAFHRKIVNGEASVNPEEIGTKGALHYFFSQIGPGKSVTVKLRFTNAPLQDPWEDFNETLVLRKKEADAFYETIFPPKATEDEKRVQRQAIAGLLWSKQCYIYDVNQWLEGDTSYVPVPANRFKIRNIHWRHLNSMRILLMPDKWEYPWFAAWDLCFHCLTMGLVDIEFAKEQLWLLLFDQFQHPNGAIPAYEWEFSDLNPPIQAWAALGLYEMQRKTEGVEDRAFLKKIFLKLLMNFSFWVNKVDSSGSNVFEGGFLGLDNISLIDRSRELGGGASLKQSDGTGWMAMFCLNLMRMALELAKDDPTYEAMATKFFQHFVYVAHAMKKMGNKQYSMWNEQDGFFYDTLVYPDGNYSPFKVRSLVGLIPLFAIDVIKEEDLKRFSIFRTNFLWFLKNRKNLTKECAIPVEKQGTQHYVLTLVDEEHLKSVLNYVWNPHEFRSPYGIRSLSKYHDQNPFYYKDMRVGYEPGEALNRIKGGNSNWRGPIWFPTNYFIIKSLSMFNEVFDIKFLLKNEGEEPVCLQHLIDYFRNGLISLFTQDQGGKRPFAGEFPFALDPHFKDYLSFNEYFHADTGKGLGASHQTGWTALVANLIDESRK